MEIVLGSDHGGFQLKKELAEYLKGEGHQVTDLGTYALKRCDYPPIGHRVAKEVASGRALRGILVCRTGIGFSIVANKIPGVRAALCLNEQMAKLSRQHNNSNILTLGANFLNQKEAKRIVEVWLKTEFLGGRHARRITQIRQIERSETYYSESS